MNFFDKMRNTDYISNKFELKYIQYFSFYQKIIVDNR